MKLEGLIIVFILISAFAIPAQVKSDPIKGDPPRAAQTARDLRKASSRDASDIPPAAVELNNQAAQLSEAKEYGGAVEGFRRAAEIAPESATIRNNLGNALMGMNLYAEALNVCRELIGSGRPNGRTYFIQGNALYELREYAESVAAYQKALQAEPRNVLMLNALGAAFFQLGNHAAALNAFESAYKADPGFPDPYNNRAATLLEMGRYREAVSELKKALAIKPDFAEAHNNLGTAFYHLGKKKPAKESYLEAVRLKPDWNYAQYNLAMYYWAAGEREAARTHFDVLRKLDAEMASRLRQEFNKWYVVQAAEQKN